MYEVIPKDDAYKDLFTSAVSLYRIIHHKGLFRQYFSEENFKTKFASSKKILQTAVNLYCDGYVDSVFYFIIELEFNRGINQNPPVSDEELCELTMAKLLVKYIREKDSEAIYNMMAYTCTGTTRYDIMPSPEWADTPD
jgi:hypothetical protein